MAISLKHAFESLIADDPDDQAAGDVLPSHWNAEHALTQAGDTILGRVGTAGATQELMIADVIALLSLEVGVDVQAYSANLDDWSGEAVADYLDAAGIAAAYQPLDADLTALASPGALSVEGSPAAGDMLVAVVDGAYKTIDWDDLPSGSGITEVAEDTSSAAVSMAAASTLPTSMTRPSTP